MQQNLQRNRHPVEENFNYPIPPRNYPKPNIQPMQQQNPPRNPNLYLSHSPETPPQLHYACLELNPPDPARKFHLESPERSKYTKINLQSHTPEKILMPTQEFVQKSDPPPPPRPAKGAHLKKPHKSQDGVDSIMPFVEPEVSQLPMQNLNINNLYKANSHQDPYKEPQQYNMNIARNNPIHSRNVSYEENRNFSKVSPEKFVNPGPSTSQNAVNYNAYDDDDDDLGAVGLNPQILNVGLPVKNGHQEVNPSISRMSQNFNEKIERLQALKVAGLSAEEIREIDKRIEQEKQDEVNKDL